MEITVEKYQAHDLKAMTEIWNSVVLDALAFPQEEILDAAEAAGFFGAQTFCGVARASDSGEILGMYILHPNNVGRCGHICNASYAVGKKHRGLGIGEKLVRHSLLAAKEHGFRIMQFNAVCAGNERARNLYSRLGFVPLGTVPGGFRHRDGSFEDICLYYRELY